MISSMIGKVVVIVSAIPVVGCGIHEKETTPLTTDNGSPATLQMVRGKLLGLENGLLFIEHDIDTGGKRYKNTVAIPASNASVTMAEELALPLIFRPTPYSAKS